jgi:hypothetical protein
MTELLDPAFNQPGGQAADQPYLDTTAYALNSIACRLRGSIKGRNAKSDAAQRTAPRKPKSCS